MAALGFAVMAELADSQERSRRQVIGWLVPADEKARLLEQIAPRYERTVADHVTLRSGVGEDVQPPDAAAACIIGEANDGKGVQALVVEIDGSSIRPGGGRFHITWSLGEMRHARESNDVIAELGWTPLDGPMPVRLEPARFPG
jgi:hypothetical protein